MLQRLEDTAIRPNPDFERLRKTLTRDGKPDYVPFYELFVNPEIQEAILGKKIVDRVSTVEFYYKAGYDCIPTWPHPDMPMGSLVDRTGGYPIEDWKSFEAYPWPDPDTVSYAEFEAVARILPDGMKMVGQTGGVFEVAEGLVGYEQLCYLMMDDPALTEAIFDRIRDLYVPMYRCMAGIDQVGAVVISDDLGFKTQTMVGVSELRRYVLPVHKLLAQIAHEAGKPCILHSCGQLVEIMDDLIDDVKIDAKHSYEDVITPVTEISKLYGDRMAVLGGFDVDRLCRGSEEEIRAYTRMLISECGARGGYALGSGNSIAAFVPVPNYLAMIDEGWRTRLR